VKCLIDGCPNTATSKGWCPMHYRRWQRHGDPLHTPPVKEPMACSNEGCPKVAVKKGLCNGHYLRARKGKDMTAPINDAPGAAPAERGICGINKCTRAVWNIERQLCRRHYHQAWKYGDATRDARLINATWEEIRDLAEPDPDTGCLLWQGPLQDQGYGTITYQGKRWLAHRLFWTQFYGPIPDGLTIDHLCFIRNCVNIPHLEAISASVNTKRAMEKRWAILQPICDKHDPTETVWVSNGEGKRKRRCRACEREKARERYHAKRNPSPPAPVPQE